MGSFSSWLLLFLILQCFLPIICQDDGEDDTDFAILDELDGLETCDGGCKAPGRNKVPKEPKKTKMPIPKQQRKKTPQEQQQEIQQMMAQYQHYLKYMEEEGNGEQPLSPQEFMEYMNYMKAGQEAGLSPEEIQEKYKKEMEAKAMQSPEVQEELKKNLPDLTSKYEDKAYAKLSDIPSDKLPSKAMGCGVVPIPKGSFHMGSEHDENYEEDGEAPYRKVKISKAFYMDACEVTNAQFLDFWHNKKQKGKTEAEKYGWSFVFELLVSDEVNREVHSAVQGAEWWIPIPGSDFRHPSGPDQTFNDVLDHPAMHIGWTDAKKYCKWKGGRLPTESEWEYACRGGLKKKKFPWGNDRTPNLTLHGTYSMNIFTGEPYSVDDGSDGWESTAIVGSYAPNGYGLYDMTGNVWEWVADYWSPRPKVPPEGRRLVDPKGPKQGRDRVMKGGSYMCHPTTCRRYRCSGRSHAEPDSSTGNLGFRCVYDKNPEKTDEQKTEL